MKADYKNNETVIFLKSVGFSDDYIEKGIESGEIKLEKSENEAARGDHESETKQEKDINKLEEEAVRREKKVKKDEKETAEDRDAEDVEKSKEKEMMKSMESTLMKSFGVFAPILENLQKSIEGMNAKLDKMGSTTPSFRSAGLENLHSIEKSISVERDDEGKFSVNIVSQRPMASKLIEKALDSAPELIRKSLEGDALAFLTNPDAETVGEDLARYMYEKGNVKLVK